MKNNKSLRFITHLIDKEEKLKSGSTKKYIEEVIRERGCFSVVSKGDETIRIVADYEEPQIFTQ